MWEKLKAYFSTPVAAPEPEPQDFVFPTQVPQTNPQPNKNWRTNMWVVYAGKVGILFEFKDDGAMFHEVDQNTGETTAEYFVSLNALKHLNRSWRSKNSKSQMMSNTRERRQ